MVTYEKGPYHAQIEFSVQGFKLKISNFFFFFGWDFYGSRASYPTFQPNMTQNEPFLASVPGYKILSLIRIVNRK